MLKHDGIVAGRQVFGLLADDGSFPGPALDEALKPIKDLYDPPVNQPDYKSLTKRIQKLNKKNGKDGANGAEGEDGLDGLDGLEGLDDENADEDDLLARQQRVSQRLKALFPNKGEKEDADVDLDDLEDEARRQLEFEGQQEGCDDMQDQAADQQGDEAGHQGAYEEDRHEDELADRAIDDEPGAETEMMQKSMTFLGMVSFIMYTGYAYLHACFPA
jgi:hypothetical protein